MASNVSEATGGKEVIDVYTKQLSDGALFIPFAKWTRGAGHEPGARAPDHAVVADG